MQHDPDAGSSTLLTHSFHAVYDAGEGRRLEAVLSAPRTLADPSLDTTQAYPLDLTFFTDSGEIEWRLRYWLDGQARLQRADDPCLQAQDGACTHMRIHWLARGSPAPLGFGGPPSDFRAAGAAHDALGDYNPSNGTATIKGSKMPAMLLLDWQGVAQWDMDGVVPSRLDVTGTHHGPRVLNLTLVELRLGSPLPPVPDIVEPLIELSTIDNEPLFPGEGRYLVRRAITYGQVVDFLRNESERAKANLAQGCLVRYSFSLPATDAGYTVPATQELERQLFYNQTRTLFNIETRSSDGVVYRHAVDHFDADRLQQGQVQDAGFQMRFESDVPWKADCNARATAPAMQYVDFVGAMNTSRVPGMGSFYSARVQWYDFDADLAKALGSVIYHSAFLSENLQATPERPVITPYQVQFRASADRWDHWLVHPQTVDWLDSQGWSDWRSTTS